MAKSKKPVIAGVGRPAGIIDDVVYPIASKVARNVLQKSIKGSSDRSFDVYKKSRQAMKKIDSRRINSYTDKSNKLYKKELEFGRSVKQITKSANKREVLEAKIATIKKDWVVVVAHTVGRSLQTPEVHGSNPLM